MPTFTAGAAMRIRPRLRVSAASLPGPSSSTITTTTTTRPPATAAAAAFICRSCLGQLSLRPASTSARTSSTPTPQPQPPPAAAYARLSSRRLISVSGPDAAKYLHGVITSSIANPDGTPRTAAGFYSAFLNAQGRVLHDVFVYPDRSTAPAGEGFLVEVDAAEAERLARHIRRYKLRARFAVRLLGGDEGGVWHAWDDRGDDGNGLDIAGEMGRAGEEGGGGGSIVLRDPRSPTLGYRVVAATGSSSGAPPPELGLSLDAAPEEAYRIRRYLHGVPEGQSEIVYEQALPLESNLDVMGAIDFRKGCYVGQELTIRTKHRGVVRKRILPCLVYGDSPDEKVQAQDRELSYQSNIGAASVGEANGYGSADEIPAGTSIGRVGKKGRSAGKWLGGVGNVGLALCRLEIMTDVVLPGEANSATAFNPADEFVLEEKLEDGQEGVGRRARVKAFVPLWLRQGLDGATPHPK